MRLVDSSRLSDAGKNGLSYFTEETLDVNCFMSWLTDYMWSLKMKSSIWYIDWWVQLYVACAFDERLAKKSNCLEAKHVSCKSGFKTDFSIYIPEVYTLTLQIWDCLVKEFRKHRNILLLDSFFTNNIRFKSRSRIDCRKGDEKKFSKESYVDGSAEWIWAISKRRDLFVSCDTYVGLEMYGRSWCISVINVNCVLWTKWKAYYCEKQGIRWTVA